jgi:hypothetical protein
MKIDTKTNWDEMIETMVQTAFIAHIWFGKGTLNGKDSPEKALAANLQVFTEACYDRLQELTEGDIT